LTAPAQRVVITIRDGKGNVVRRFASDDPEPPAVQFDKPSYWERPFQRPDASIGMHRFAWDLHEPSPQSVMVDLPISANPGDTPRTPQGALVVPGRYTVELTVDGRSQSRPLVLQMDPRIHISSADLQRQYQMAHETAVLMSSTYDALQSAKRANQTKRATQFGQLNTRLTGLMDLIDGADAPVPDGTRRAFCSLRMQSMSARGALPVRNSICP
jgi:hypothetical protein